MISFPVVGVGQPAHRLCGEFWAVRDATGRHLFYAAPDDARELIAHINGVSVESVGMKTPEDEGGKYSTTRRD
jgi:hypothetical protein